jgi:hypothetical protein
MRTVTAHDSGEMEQNLRRADADNRRVVLLCVSESGWARRRSRHGIPGWMQSQLMGAVYEPKMRQCLKPDRIAIAHEATDRRCGTHRQRGTPTMSWTVSGSPAGGMPVSCTEARHGQFLPLRHANTGCWQGVEPFFCYRFCCCCTALAASQPVIGRFLITFDRLGGNADSPLLTSPTEENLTHHQDEPAEAQWIAGGQPTVSQPARCDARCSKRSNTTPPPALPHRQLLAQTSSLRTPVPGLLTLVCSWIPPRVLNLPA